MLLQLIKPPQAISCNVDSDFQVKYLTAYANKLKLIRLSGKWKTLRLKKNYKINSKCDEIKSIINNLQLLDYYTNQQIIDSDVFDTTLEIALKRFQYFHHIDTTGIIGIKTRKFLNQSIDDQIKVAEWNIEQWRKSDLKCEDHFVFINLAACHLKVVENNKIKLQMKVIVGRPTRPSFVLTSFIDQVEFNPYWVVPPGILRNDIIPKYEKDKNFLTKNELEVLTWNNIPLKYLPEAAELVNFKLQQAPGDKNPLGKVKFNFKNSYFMFLHDTPNKYLFTNYPSAFSSGCIRLENAISLVNYLLSREGNLSQFDKEELLKNNENKVIKLKQPVKLIIQYFTMWVNEKGELHVEDDFYKKIN
jgi:murein L,D-transpeptidase YcbB/YkuD